MDIKHGVNGYNKHACRCDICKTAKSEQRFQKKPRASKLKLDYEPLLRKLEASDQLHLIDLHRIYQWREAGGINVYWADKWAIKFGWHPAEVWGMAFYEGCFNEDNCLS